MPLLTVRAVEAFRSKAEPYNITLDRGLQLRIAHHAAAGDVTLGHYVAKSEAQLRAGWQAVAYFVEGAALRE